MKKTFLLLSLFFKIISFSQNFSILKGERFRPEMNSLFDYYIGKDTNAVYIKRTSPEGIGFKHLIQKIDSKTQKTVYNQQLEIDGGEKVLKTYLTNNRILLFTVKYDKKEDMQSLILRQYNTLDAKQISAFKEVSFIVCEKKETQNANFHFAFSPDDSKMAIIKQRQNYGHFEEINFDVYEIKTMNKIVEKSNIKYPGICIPIDKAFKYIPQQPGNILTHTNNFKLNNEGALLHFISYLIDFKAQTGTIGFAYLSPENKEVTLKNIPMNKMDIQDCSLEFLGNDILLAGVFSDVITDEEKKEGKTKKVGVYSLVINPKTIEIKKTNHLYFTKDINDKLIYDAYYGKNPSDRLFLNKEIFTFNENIYLLENHPMVTVQNIVFNHEREILVSKINKTGNIEWTRIIPKFNSNKLNGFNYLINNNKINFIYAEHPNNLSNGTVNEYNPKKYKYIYHYNKSILVCATLDEEGKLSRKQIEIDENWFYEPTQKNIILENNSLLLRMINNAEERYDKVSID